MASKRLTITLVLVMTLYHVTQAIILRPNWWPYFKESEQQNNNGRTVLYRRIARQLPATTKCPAGVPQYECYQELMAAWMRVMDTEKRTSRKET